MLVLNTISPPTLPAPASASPLKAAPNGFEPTSDEAHAAMAALIADSFDWFKGLVKDRRGLTDEELAKVDDGRVFTGRQGLPLKLVDAIGDERDAIAWLEKDRGVASTTESRFSQIRAALRFAILLIRRNGDWRRRWSIRRNRAKGVLLGMSIAWRRFWAVRTGLGRSRIIARAC